MKEPGPPPAASDVANPNRHDVRPRASDAYLTKSTRRHHRHSDFASSLLDAIHVFDVTHCHAMDSIHSSLTVQAVFAPHPEHRKLGLTRQSRRAEPAVAVAAIGWVPLIGAAGRWSYLRHVKFT